MKPNDIEDLARTIYPKILPRARQRNGDIAYSELCASLEGRWAGLEPRSEMLSHALGLIVERCREADLPALSALVVRAGERRPGPGYYTAAHPDIDDPMKREIAWAKERGEAHRRCAEYPDTFDEL